MSFYNKKAGIVADKIISTILENKAYLSDIDSIGDGDHGINMSKGMNIARMELSEKNNYNMTDGFKAIQNSLMNKIGGSMGPLYGMIFLGFITATENKELIDAETINQMLDNAYNNLTLISDAKPGDKTLIDVLLPAINAYKKAHDNKKDMNEALSDLIKAANIGLESTKNMISKIGRASRLGKKTLGHQDAGATSCTLILTAMAEAMIELNKECER